MRIITVVKTPTGPAGEWVATTRHYRECDGGVKAWMTDMEQSSAEYIYLFDIKARFVSINGISEMVYDIRYSK